MPNDDSRSTGTEADAAQEGQAQVGRIWPRQFAEEVASASTAVLDVSVQAWNVGWGGFFWAQDSADRMVRLWLGQWRIMLEQLQQLQADTAALMRRNQADVQRMVQGAALGGVASVSQLQGSALDEMQRRVDELIEQLEAVRRE